MKKNLYDNTNYMIDDYRRGAYQNTSNFKNLEHIIDEQEYIDSYPLLKELIRMYSVVGV